MRLRHLKLLSILFFVVGRAGLSAQEISVFEQIAAIKQLKDDSVALRRLTVLEESTVAKLHPDSLALILHEKSNVMYSLGMSDESMQAVREAATLRYAYRTEDPESYCRSIYNLALGFRELGQRDSVRKYFAEVLHFSPVLRQKSKCAFELGKDARTVGDYGLAIQYGYDALRYAKEGRLTTELINACTLILDIQTTQLHQGETTSADSIFSIVPRFRSYFPDPAESDCASLIMLAKLSLYESYAYKDKEDYSKTLDRLHTAMALLYQNDEDMIAQEIVFHSELYNSLGIVLRRTKKYAESLDALTQALSIREQVGDRTNVAVTYNNLGDLYFDQGMYARALQSYDASINLILDDTLYLNHKNRLPFISDLQSERKVLQLFRYITFKADCLRQYCGVSQSKDECQQALQSYALADSLIEMVRAEQLRENSKLFWRKDAKRMYAGAIEAALGSGQDALGLYYADRSKAVLVLDAVREHALRQTDLQDLVRRKDSLVAQILILESQNAQADDWSVAVADLDGVNRQIQTSLPGLGSTDSVYDLEALTAHMAEDEAVIEYFEYPATDSENQPVLYAFVLSSSGIRAVPLDYTRTSQAIDEYLTENQGFLFKSVASRAHEDDDLFNLLIRPLGILPSKLMIIPDGKISQVSFDGLRDEEGKFLVETRAIRYNLSLALAQMLNEEHLSEHTQVLAFAPMTSARCDQVKLSWTREEVADIAGIVRTDKRIGNAAQKSLAMHTPEINPILHFATHAYADTSDPGNSWVALAGKDSECDMLSVHDLYTTHIPTPMVVVSACEGAYGTYASGEGAMSLARGFSYAGASSVVTSLWQVNDAATATLMKSFYANLVRGMTKSEALREAKLGYIRDPHRKKQELHPAWWSAFIVIGNDTPLSLAKPPGFLELYWVYVLACLSLMAVVIFTVRRKTTSKSEFRL